MPLDLDDVLRFFSRFDRVASHLNRRRKGKDPFKVEDEYDVQDLAYALLKPLVPDLTKENPSQKVAGAGGRLDLSSTSLGMVVEVKAALKEGREKDILKECRDRVKLYSVVPGINWLVFFIYDPEHRIDDLDNVKLDLEGPQHRQDRSGDFEILVVGPGLPEPVVARRSNASEPGVSLVVDDVRPYFPTLSVLVGATLRVAEGHRVDCIKLRLGKTEVRTSKPLDTIIESVQQDVFPDEGVVGPARREAVLHFGLGDGLGQPVKFGSSGLLEVWSDGKVVANVPVDLPEPESKEVSDVDAEITLRSWFVHRPADDACLPVNFADVDLRLQLPPGTSKRLLEKSISGSHAVAQKGEQFVTFKRLPAKPLNLPTGVGRNRRIP
jgi:REase_DpnII-MboI